MSYAAVKAAFRGSYTGYQGLLYLLVNVPGRDFERAFFVVVSDAEALKVRPHANWSDFEEAILRAKFEGKVAPNLSADMERKLKEKVDGEMGREFLRILEAGGAGAIQETLSYEIGRMIGDAEVSVSCHVETVPAEVVHPPQPASDSAPAPEAPPAAVPQAVPQETPAVRRVMEVKVDPVLAPVSGIPVGRLAPGRRILVKITDPSDAAKTISRLLAQAGTSDAVGTAAAEVIAADAVEYDRVKLRVRLLPGVEGTTVISKELKVKGTGVRVPASPEEVPTPRLDDFEEADAGLNPIVLFGGFAVVLVILIVVAWGLFLQ